MNYPNKAFIFPGQGAQYVGMGKDFAEAFPLARQTFEHANDILRRDITKIIFEGPENTLTETHNSQVGIYITSIAIWQVMKQTHPAFVPCMTAGLSLGEYTALTVAGKVSFEEGLMLVQRRGSLMSDACNKNEGTMAVVLGLSAEEVEKTVVDLNMPHDLWAANFNCPGQVVISGTKSGIEKGAAALKNRGAKRVLPLPVHGAFHSGLMKEAELGLADNVLAIPFHKSSIKLAMNVVGEIVSNEDDIRSNLIKQVTHPVRWQQCVNAMENEGASLFAEIGCGKALTGFNKRIETKAPTISIEKVQDLDLLEKYL
jgi:[acyl-carrier-protein] S-malonyltransferase